MPTDTQAIGELSNEIARLSKSFAESSFQNKELQQQMVVAAEKLAIATREPDENVYHDATQIAHNSALRSVIGMGVFEHLPSDNSPMSTHDLAASCTVNPELLDRLMRALSSVHLFHNPAPNHYAHTCLSQCYTIASRRAMFAQMYDFTSKGVFALPEFLGGNNYTSAGTYDQGPFQLGAKTDLGFWEYLHAKPERMQLFSAGMRAKTTIGSGRASGAFPFGHELKDVQATDIAVVDVGGGRGQALEAIVRDWPQISGRKILQDLPHVIEDAESKGLPTWMETSKASFFEPQVVHGARIYYFRRIFHDWDQTKGREILLNTAAAMNEYSRVLIADMALPNVDAPRDMALQDLNMMSFGGMERNEQQWKELIGSAGLVLRKFWSDKGGAKHAVVEAVLPGFKGGHVQETNGVDATTAP